MSTLSKEMTDWLGANLPEYETILLHAIFHDSHHRADLLDRLKVMHRDFREPASGVVIGGMLKMNTIARQLGREVPYPPLPHLMVSYINLFAREEFYGDADVEDAIKLVEKLKEPSLKDQHHTVNPYLEAWVGLARGALFARKLMMRKIPEVGPFLEELSDTLALAREIANPSGFREFDFDNPPEPPEPVLKLSDRTICTPGNISNIQGPPKAAKSAVVGAVLASMLLEQGREADTLGFTGGNENGRAVIHIDTEQSLHDHHSMVRRAYKRANRETKADWLRSHSLIGLEPAMCLEYLVRTMRLSAEEHGGVRLVIIDGIADFCTDPNDAEECFALIRKLHRLASDYRCVILTVLHENPGSAAGKTRGHLGSHLDRKVETSLRVAKDEKSGSVTLWVERGRHCFMPKNSGWQFQWCDEAGMHVSLQEDDAAFVRPRPDKPAKYTAEVAKAFGDAETVSFSDLVKALVKAANMAESTAKARVREYLDMGLVEKVQDGKYRVVSPLRAA
jgi:AAA domain